MNNFCFDIASFSQIESISNTIFLKLLRVKIPKKRDKKTGPYGTQIAPRLIGAGLYEESTVDGENTRFSVPS
jgi:hypothetical protein